MLIHNVNERAKAGPIKSNGAQTPLYELNREHEYALEDGETVCFLFPVCPPACLLWHHLEYRSFINKEIKTCEKLVLKVEARDCHKVWTCKGQDRCWEDCKNRYSGKGLCDLYTAPPVPKQCFCAYKC
ncbi:hypothetical protein SADUNF_Sadunf13G0027700 [Salix dunnii]|uniref:Uncharacterized protein n=1 Tax=Salix dunnii TaxID=1413687 RepID=A0A835JN46_9ROSI|nr:hypothetical protein SADUNF_Sadunf13G0027700 [Salix dunnii]